jgi:hypothetical protein
MNTHNQGSVSIRSEVLAQFTQVAEEQNKELAPLMDDLPLLESGLDSLCFAVIVARLEDVLGTDPFSAAADAPFPVTLGEFVKSYQDAAA